MKKHSTDGMQPRYNSLIYACVSAYSSGYQQLATAVLRIALCVYVYIDELHEYGDLPDDFSNEMKTSRVCEARAQ